MGWPRKCSPDDYAILDGDEQAVVAVDVGVGELLANLGLDAIDVAGHGAGGVHENRDFRGEDLGAHDGLADEVAPIADADAHTRADAAARAAAETLRAAARGHARHHRGAGRDRQVGKRDRRVGVLGGDSRRILGQGLRVLRHNLVRLILGTVAGTATAGPRRETIGVLLDGIGDGRDDPDRGDDDQDTVDKEEMVRPSPPSFCQKERCPRAVLSSGAGASEASAPTSAEPGGKESSAGGGGGVSSLIWG